MPQVSALGRVLEPDRAAGGPFSVKQPVNCQMTSTADDWSIACWGDQLGGVN